MALQETLLAIRREYSKEEKFKLILAEIVRLQDELAFERKKNTDLIKQIDQLKNENK